MPSSHRRARPAFWLLLALLPSLLGSGSRFQQSHSPQPVDVSNERYVNDLQGSDKSDRLYAARTLRSRLRVAMNELDAPEGSLRQLDAIATMDDLHHLAAPACIEALASRNVAHHCAQMLGWLGYEPAVPALEAMLSPDSEASKRAQRQAARALEAIRAAAP
jgi:hypothetical protein